MHKVLMVIRREYLERVKKKSFWVGLALFPFLMSAMIGGQFLLMKVTPEEQRKLAVVDSTGRLFEPLDEALSKKTLKGGERQYPLEKVPIDPAGGADAMDAARKSVEGRVGKDDLYAILVIGPDIDKKGNYGLYAGNVGNIIASETVENALEDAVVGERLNRSNVKIEREVLDKITAPIDLETFQVSAGGESKKKNFLETYFGTFAFVMLLYISLLVYGIAVMRGILEEKSSRVMEVLLGPLTPNQIMTGKVLGIGMVGLTQMAVYMIAAGAMRGYVGIAAVQGDWVAMLDAFSPMRMFYLVVFFLLGYFMYVAMFAAIGAVCNTEQEAQNLQGPVTMCLVLPMVATFFFVNNPDSTPAVVTSLIPLFAPMVMYMRICVNTPPIWQILLSIALLLVAIAILFRAAAKIFRIGILMYGKRPTIPEILRWARS